MRKKRSFSDCDLLFDDYWMSFTTNMVEYIKQTGKNEWTIWYVTSDPNSDEGYEKYTHDIRSLISYVLERDTWLDEKADVAPEIPLSKSEKEYFEHTHSWGTLGPHMNTLLNILYAKELHKELLMAKAAAGITWIHPDEIVDSDSIGMKIVEIIRKPIWIRTYTKAFGVITYYGTGLIYPPKENSVTTFVLDEDQDSYSFDFKPRKVRLSTCCMDELLRLQKNSFKNSLIFHIPHASKVIPEWMRDQFLLSDEELEKELLIMTDHYTDELFTTKEHPYVTSPVSRLVLDVERFTDDIKEPMANIGMGAIYTSTHDGRNLRRELAPHETKRLLRKYHQRNEASVTSAIKYALLANDVALVFDCHSFPSEPLLFEEDQSLPRADICIGTDAFHTPSRLMQMVASFFEKLGYSVELNKPYKGTFVPALYYKRNKKVQSIMIELNRSLYMDETTGEKRASFDQLQTQISELLYIAEQYLIPDATKGYNKSPFQV